MSDIHEIKTGLDPEQMKRIEQSQMFAFLKHPNAPMPAWVVAFGGLVATQIEEVERKELVCLFDQALRGEFEVEEVAA